MTELRNYEALANAIVIKAAEDYRFLRKKEKRLGGLTEDRDVVRLYDVISFFKGDWIKKLTKVNGEYIMRKIDEEIRNMKPAT